MRSARLAALSVMVLALSVLLIMPSTASDAAVTDADVRMVSYSDRVEISAGTSESFKIEVANHLGHLENDLSNSRMVSVAFVSPEGAAVTIAQDDRDFILVGQENRSIVVGVEVDKYAAAGDYAIGVILTVKDMDGNSLTYAASGSVPLEVLSPLSSEETYNKVLGIFKNPLPEPFGGPLATSAISFLILMLIGIAATMVLIPLIVRVLTHSDKESEAKVKKALRLLVPLAVLLFAFDNALRVYGAAEEIIGTFDTWRNILYIILGAIIIWRVYIIFIQGVLSKIAKNQRIDQKDMDLEPLFRLIGKLVLWVMCVAIIMSILGFNLTAIITSAGVISLGITLGAQSILSQFFSGMVLLTTRPFKSGDLIRVGDSGIYRVKSVNLMSTTFDNWDNEESVIMPNNLVSSSIITNLTGEGLIYKIAVYVGISYDDDVDLAKSLMEKAAHNHPSVITNGSVDIPYTRLTAFNDSSVELRLSSYVYDYNDSGKVGGELREAIFKMFKENGVSIPFPQTDVHVKYDIVKDEAKKGSGE